MVKATFYFQGQRVIIFCIQHGLVDVTTNVTYNPKTALREPPRCTYNQRCLQVLINILVLSATGIDYMYLQVQLLLIHAGFYRTQYPASYTHKSLGRTPQFTLTASPGTQTCFQGPR